MQSISILFFSAELRSFSIYYSVGAHTATTLQDVLALHQAQLFVPISSFILSTWRLPIYWIWEHNLSTWGAKIHTQYFQYHTITAIVIWNILCFCCTLRYFLHLHRKPRRRKVLHRAGYSCHVLVQWIFEQKCQEPRYSSIAQSLEIREEHFRNHQRYARRHIHAVYSTTLEAWSDCHDRIHAVAFDLSSIRTASLSCCTHTVAPALRHTHGVALMPQHPEGGRSKRTHRSTRWTVRVSIEIWESCRDLCTLCICWRAQRSARRAKLLQLSKWVFSFCIEFFPRSLTRGKNPVCPEKKLYWGKFLSQVLDRAGLELAGIGRDRAGMKARAGSGRAGPGGRAYFYIKMCLGIC